MQGLYAHKSTIEERNKTISSEIGKFLNRNRDLLQIEKGPKRISINMNGKKSPARIWHKNFAIMKRLLLLTILIGLLFTSPNSFAQSSKPKRATIKYGNGVKYVGEIRKVSPKGFIIRK